MLSAESEARQSCLGDEKGMPDCVLRRSQREVLHTERIRGTVTVYIENLAVVWLARLPLLQMRMGMST